MGCSASMFQCCSSAGVKEKKAKKTEENGDAVDGEVTDSKSKKKNEKKSKDKKKKNDKSSGGEGANEVQQQQPQGDAKSNETPKAANGSAKNGTVVKSGSAISTAKVRPLTPTQKDVPKPVAFDINLDGQKEAEKKPETEEVKPRLSFPRRLPKLSSFGSKNEVKTTDEILEKQKKVEEKRKEKLEEKKQKARKFMDKFSKSTESIDPPNEIEVNSGEEEPKSSGESTTKAMVSSVTEQTTTVVNSVVVSDGAE